MFLIIQVYLTTWSKEELTGHLPTVTVLFEGLMVGVVKLGLVVPSPEANKAL